MKVSRRECLTGIVGGVSVFALGSSGLSAQQSPNRGNTIRFAPLSEPTNFDPHYLASYPVRNASYMSFDTLFSIDSKGEVRPQMVDSFEISPDAVRFSFKLRSGLAWHDGQKVTAEDCVASLRRWAKRDSMGQIIAASLASLAPESDDTFTLTLKEPLGIVLQALGKGGAVVPFMMPARDAGVEDLGPRYRPMGSGPFIFNKEMHQPGNRIVWDKNPNYVPRSEPADFLAGGKRVKIERVEWTILPNPNSQVAALQSGEIDYLEWVDYDQIDVLKGDRNIQLINVDPIGKQGYLRLNHLVPPFNNPKMREAMLYLVDQQAYLRAMTGNRPEYFSTCGAYFMCGLPLGSETGAIKPDLAKAKALFKEAGYDGAPIKMFQVTNLAGHKVAGLVTGQLLKKAGLAVDSIPIDLTTMLTRRRQKDIWNMHWGYIEGIDAGSPLTSQYLRANCEAAMPGWPCDAKLEALRTSYAHEVDPQQRKILIDQIQLAAYEDLPYILTGQYRIPTAVRANVRNVLLCSLPVFWEMEKVA